MALAIVAIAGFASAGGAGADNGAHLTRTAAKGNKGRNAKPHRRRTAAAPRSVRAHIETWAFDDGCNGGDGASAALVRPWVTFAESNCGVNAGKARADCHAGGRVYCDVMQYLDTAWDLSQEASVPMASAASDNWWLHETSPHNGVPIYSTTFGGGYLMNQAMPSVRAYFRSFVRSHFDADDGLLMDWQAASLTQELYFSTCACATTSEIRSSAALRRAHGWMSAALTHRNGTPFMQIDNSLPVNPYLPQGMGMLNRSTGVDGWGAEGEPENYGALDPYYSTLLDQIAYIETRTHGAVVMLSRGDHGAAYEQQSRRVQEATMLLGFSQGHLVDWADLEQGNGDLAVWPEEGIYPTRPAQSMRAPRGRGCLKGTGVACSRGGHNNVQVAPGVYRRVFRNCYVRRVAFGRCAAIVNTTAGWVAVKRAWLGHYSFRHQITFNGGDVQSGGTIDLTGARFRAGSTFVAPDDAMLLSR
jgi:hypothetical protein